MGLMFFDGSEEPKKEPEESFGYEVKDEDEIEEENDLTNLEE